MSRDSDGLRLEIGVAMWTTFVLMIALGILSGAGRATSESVVLGPDDFAVGRILEANQPGSVQSVLLDYDVYRRSVEPRLADLRVFDANGDPVPYAIRRRVRTAQPEIASVEVPLFHLSRDSTSPSASVDRGADSGFRIDAELSASGAIVSVHNGSSERVAGDRTAGWLLDLSALDRAVVGLELALGEGGGDFVTPVRLESSDDLVSFDRIDSEIALARLVQNGHRIERTEFEIPKTRTRYLRMTPVGGAPDAALMAVRARIEPKQSLPPSLRQSIAGRMDPGEPGVVLFDLEATPPIETIQVRLTGPNTIVEGRLASAPTPEGPWRVRQRGVYYLFEKEGELRNPPMRLSSDSDRYLRFETSTRGGGLSGEPPSLEVVWRPEQLLYVQRGDAPSLLAIGRVDTPSDGFAADDLLRSGDRRRIEAVAATASLGPEAVLGGPSVLERETPIPWRSFGLWALLLVSVGVVLGLSFRLLRDSEV